MEKEKELIDRVRSVKKEGSSDEPPPQEVTIRFQNKDSAEGGTRTHTALRPPDFESGASANFTTSAGIDNIVTRQKMSKHLFRKRG